MVQNIEIYKASINYLSSFHQRLFKNSLYVSSGTDWMQGTVEKINNLRSTITCYSTIF